MRWKEVEDVKVVEKEKLEGDEVKEEKEDEEEVEV